MISLLVALAGPALVSGKVRGGVGVLGSLLPPDYDKMTAPPHLEGEKSEILVDLEVLGIPRFDEVIWSFGKDGSTDKLLPGSGGADAGVASLTLLEGASSQCLSGLKKVKISRNKSFHFKVQDSLELEPGAVQYFWTPDTYLK